MKASEREPPGGAPGWEHVKGWLYRAPSGSLHDLSAADLRQLVRIETEGLFVSLP